MATATQANSVILLSSYRRHRASSRRDRWLVALMTALVVVMLAGLARRVDAQALAGDERAPAVLLD